MICCLCQDRRAGRMQTCFPCAKEWALANNYTEVRWDIYPIGGSERFGIAKLTDEGIHLGVPEGEWWSSTWEDLILNRVHDQIEYEIAKRDENLRGL